MCYSNIIDYFKQNNFENPDTVLLMPMRNDLNNGYIYKVYFTNLYTCDENIMYFVENQEKSGDYLKVVNNKRKYNFYAVLYYVRDYAYFVEENHFQR